MCIGQSGVHPDCTIHTLTIGESVDVEDSHLNFSPVEMDSALPVVLCVLCCCVGRTKLTSLLHNCIELQIDVVASCAVYECKSEKWLCVCVCMCVCRVRRNGYQ